MGGTARGGVGKEEPAASRGAEVLIPEAPEWRLSNYFLKMFPAPPSGDSLSPSCCYRQVYFSFYNQAFTNLLCNCFSELVWLMPTVKWTKEFEWH